MLDMTFNKLNWRVRRYENGCASYPPIPLAHPQADNGILQLRALTRHTSYSVQPSLGSGQSVVPVKVEDGNEHSYQLRIAFLEHEARRHVRTARIRSANGRIG